MPMNITLFQIEEKNQRCLLKYEDNSKYWSMFKDIHRSRSKVLGTGAFRPQAGV